MRGRTMKKLSSKYVLIMAWFMALGIGFSGGLVIFDTPQSISSEGPRLPFCDQKPLDGPNCISRESVTTEETKPAERSDIADQVARVIEEKAFGR